MGVILTKHHLPVLREVPPLRVVAEEAAGHPDALHLEQQPEGEGEEAGEPQEVGLPELGVYVGPPQIQRLITVFP